MSLHTVPFSGTTILLASLGGIIPALIWLLFWLREDRLRPEPRGRIVLTFFAGILTVIAVIPIEKWTQELIVSENAILVIWAFIEEAMKYIFVWFVALRGRDMDEPVDAIIYMITGALGFAGFENLLFLLSPIEAGLVAESFITGNMRFLGATILHTLASGIVGVFIAFAFWKGKRVWQKFAILGLILAVVLHALFNAAIMHESQVSILTVFSFVWLGTIGLLMIFEKVKNLKRPARGLFSRK